MRRKDALQPPEPSHSFELCLGSGEVRVEIQGMTDDVVFLEGPSLYVASQVAQNYLEKKLYPFRKQTRRVDLDPIRKPLKLAWSNCEISIQLWVYLKCNRILEKRAKAFTKTALQQAGGAVLLMISELADHEEPISPSEYEAFFATINDGLIAKDDRLSAFALAS